MKSPASLYFSALAKRRFQKDNAAPKPSPEVVAALKNFGSNGGRTGGNVLSSKRDCAFKKGNSARWRRFYAQHGLRPSAVSDLPPKPTGGT
jgi:hypothetical protein